MAARRPWYQRNGSAMIFGTLHMPDAEHKWAYSAIIDMLNDRDQPIPDDAKFICGFTGLSRKKWNIVRAFLLSDTDAQGDTRLSLTEAGDITNPRFERELAARQGDHVRSVEAGREGGKKSAQQRRQAQAGQGDLNLSGVYEADKRDINGPKNAPRMENKSAIDEPDRSNFNELAEAPPQATRAGASARQRLEIENHTNEQSESITETPEIPPIDRSDLVALMHACTRAAGFSPSLPGAIAREIDFVKAWRELGADFDRVVIPTIRSLIATSTDPTSSLKRFDRRMRLEIAKSAGSAKPGDPAYKPPAEPILQIEGEPQIMHAIRLDLLKAIGPAAYCMFANPIRLEQVEEPGGDRNPLRIIDPRPSSMQIINSIHQTHVRKIAQNHGFTDVW